MISQTQRMPVMQTFFVKVVWNRIARSSLGMGKTVNSEQQIAHSRSVGLAGDFRMHAEQARMHHNSANDVPGKIELFLMHQ